MKKARSAIQGGDAKAAAAPVKEASKALARAASKGAIPARSASRVTARIQAALAKASQPASK